MIHQFKDLRPFVGLQNKGCRDCDVQQKKKCLNKHFSGELKKGKKYHANGITSCPSSGKTNITAGRLLGKEHSIYSTPATHSAGGKVLALISGLHRDGRGRPRKL
jgi:hypothetical protein